jgi:hypothetical protein
MTGEAAEMMGLLRELALMKEMDAEYERGPKGEAEAVEFEERKRRRQEISERIVSLGGTVN